MNNFNVSLSYINEPGPILNVTLAISPLKNGACDLPTTNSIYSINSSW